MKIKSIRKELLEIQFKDSIDTFAIELRTECYDFYKYNH